MRIPAENVKIYIFQGCDFAHVIGNVPEPIMSNSEFFGRIKAEDGTILADFEIAKTTDTIALSLTSLETALIPQGTHEYSIIQTQLDGTVKYPFINGFAECKILAAL